MKSKSYKKEKFLQGNIKIHANGFGFVIPDDKEHPDIYIPPESIKSALTNDYVKVLVQNRRGGSKKCFGSVQSILKRGTQFVVGPYEVIDGEAVIKNHNLDYNKNILVSNPQSIPIKPKDWIKLKITQYPDFYKPLKGEVIENLGSIDSSSQSDAKRVLAESNISVSFPEPVLQELQSIPDKVENIDFKNRKDLRDKNFVTIDGETAKDFDDAILVEKHSFGYRLFVAIADVSHYVKINSKLDQEAFERSNSTYFPNFCIPMLPEKISNNICSLNPLQPRLVLVAEMDLSFQGEIIKSDLYLGAIESKHRLTYEKVQELIDNDFKDQSLDFLKPAWHLAKILVKNHYQKGALNLDIEETNILLDDVGEPVKVIKEARLFTHQMIEQFMLQANQVASTFLEKHNQHLIYRIHEKPKEDKVRNLNIFSQKLGYSSLIQSRKNMVDLLSQFRTHDKKDLLQKLVLRSLSQARYSVDNKQHYGLNFKSYTHFTSPIRRYCDLMIHRLIKSIILDHSKSSFTEKKFELIATHISEKEQKSVKAERQFKDIKKARLLSRYVGETYTGVVSSVTSFGLFIHLKEFDIEGLIRLKDLPERWIVDEIHLKIVAQRSNYTIQFGDEVTIQVVAANATSRFIDFKLLTHKDKPLAQSESRSEPRKKLKTSYQQQERRHKKKKKSKKNPRKKSRYN